MQRERIKHILMRPAAGGAVTVRGWLRTARHQKWGSFLEVNDGSTIKNIQCVVDSSLPNYEAEIKPLQTGASVRIDGELIDSPGKGQRFEVKASAAQVYGNAEEFPLQKKGHTMEFLRTIAHLRPRSNTFGAVLRVRNEMARAIHEFYQSRGFIYLQTPIITASDCEGAGAMFHVTTLDLNNPPRAADGKVDYSQDFFGKPANLTVSGQLNAETAALALSDVYTFGPTFRAENSNTTRHLAEFWMVEPECAFFDLADDMQLAEDFLKHLFKSVLDNCPDMAFFAERIDKTAIETLTHIVESEFARLTYTEAVAILQKSGRAFEFPVQWGGDLQSEHERYLAEEHVKRPLILTDYPKGIKAFYMRQNDDGKTVAAMDVLVPKIGEIIGGSQREERLDHLLARIREMKLPEADYWWYLDTRRFGTAPHAGFGLGFERTVQFATGLANIRDAIPFPRTPGSAEF